MDYMLPYIEEGKKHPRFESYKTNNYLYSGNHYKVFNINEHDHKENKFEYLCFDLLKQAVRIKTDFIWQESPSITFQSEELQAEFDALRRNTSFDQKMADLTTYSYVYGDYLAKIIIDDNLETANTEDKELSIILQSPDNWYPLYNEYSPARPATENSIVFEKDIKENGKTIGEAYLIETHKPGEINYLAFYEAKNASKYVQVPLLRYWSDQLQGIVVNGEVKEDTMDAVLYTNCTYSLLHRLTNKKTPDCYFGSSDYSLPVVSKLNAINNYSNLADVIIVTNTFPKLIVEEKLTKLIDRIANEFNDKEQGSVQNINEIGSLIDSPKSTFMKKQTYAGAYIYKTMMDKMKIIPSAGEGKTEYLKNDFSLEEIRKQHNIFTKALMSELGISEILYNPELASGNLSGVAYKRLLSTTLAEVERKKRELENFLKKTVYTMLELGKNNGLIINDPEMPEVRFADGVVNDEKETLENLVIKIQNKLIPTLEAIQEANNIDEKTAKQYQEDMKNSNQSIADILQNKLNPLDKSQG